MNKFVMAFALGASLATPAMAQSDDAKPTFTGPHIGISTGWNRGADKNVLPASGKNSEGKSGVAVRGNVGYDFPIGNSAIIGAELGIANGGRNIQTVRGASRYVTNPGFTMDATARIGVKPANNVLLFAKGGWAMERVKTSLYNGTTTLADRNTEHGFIWGAGAEFAVSKNVALRADFDRVSFNEHYKRSRLMGGVNIRF